MDLPEPAIRWLVLNASSNAELACISNVCRKWREDVKIVLLEIARNSLENKSDKEPPKLLLLPSMLRYVMSKEMNTNNDIETYCLAWFNPEGIRFKQLPIEAQSDSDEGGLIMKVGDHGGVESPQSFAPGGEQLYAGSEDEKKKNARRQPMRATSLRALENGGSDQFENCLYQWDGCQTPEEVLLPFGYAPSFIQVNIYIYILWGFVCARLN